MRHNYLRDDNSGDHWAVSSSTTFLPGQCAKMLFQLQKNGEQVRVSMTAEQAEEVAAELIAHAAKVRAAKPITLDWPEDEIQKLTQEPQARYREAYRIQTGGSD